MKTLLTRLLVLTLLLMFLSLPILAQEATEAPPVPTLELVPTAPVIVEAPAPEASFIDANTLLIAGSIVLTLVTGAAFFLAMKALDALKVSVPQETITAFGTQLITVMTNTMAGLQTKVESTDTPFDDIFYQFGKVGTNYLIEAIKRRTLTEEQQATLASLGQVSGKTTEGTTHA